MILAGNEEDLAGGLVVWRFLLAISFGERGPDPVPGETHVEEIIRFLKISMTR